MSQRATLTRDTRRNIMLLAVGFWAAIIVVTSGRDLLTNEPPTLGYAALTLAEYCLDVMMAAVLAWIVVATRRLAARRRVVLLVAGTIGVAVLHCLIDAYLIRASAAQMNVAMPPAAHMIVRSLVSFLLMHAMFVIALELILSAVTVRETEARLAAAHHAAQAAQLAALRFQLNPHFLFNTLNAISSLILARRNAEAEQMTMRLSDFLRSSLEADPQEEVTLDQELATTQSYLDIESVRFGERLQIDFASPAALLDAGVPSFLLQPLVENAIKYAVAPSRRPVTISIHASAASDRLRIVVEDDGRQAFGTSPAGGTGLGLANVRQRLAAFYGDAASLDAVATERGFAVTLALPLRRLAGTQRAAA